MINSTATTTASTTSSTAKRTHTMYIQVINEHIANIMAMAYSNKLNLLGFGEGIILLIKINICVLLLLLLILLLLLVSMLLLPLQQPPVSPHANIMTNITTEDKGMKVKISLNIEGKLSRIETYCVHAGCQKGVSGIS